MINQVSKSLIEIYKFFTKENIPYFFIDSIALQYWGEPRFTKDIDLTILPSPMDEKSIIEKILSFSTPKISNALDFAIKNRICLVRKKYNNNIDISLDIPGYEEEVMKRAVEFQIYKKEKIKICSAEDLAIHKAISSRPQDLYDIESNIIRQHRKFDKKYIKKWLKTFSEVMETNEITEKFEKLWRKLNKNEKN